MTSEDIVQNIRQTIQLATLNLSRGDGSRKPLDLLRAIAQASDTIEEMENFLGQYFAMMDSRLEAIIQESTQQEA